MRKDRRRSENKEKRRTGRFSRPGTVNVLSILALSFSALLVYSNTFHSPFHFDDFSSIVWNGPVHNLSNLPAIWAYAPSRVVTYVSFALNYRLGLLNVIGYHIFNFAVHVGAGLAAWWLVLLLLRAPSLRELPVARHSRVLAFFVALLFIVHPLQTQAVTYVVQRAASLAAAFYLLAVALYVRARLFQGEGQVRKSVLFYGGSFLAGLIAMFSKETAFTLPAMIVLVELLFMSKGSTVKWRVLVIISSAFLAVLGLALAFKIVVIPEVAGISRTQYLLTQFRVLVTYLRLFILPVNQNLDYDFALSRGILEPGTALSLLLLLALFAVALFLLRRNKLGAFAVFWFFLTLLPESSIFPLPDVIFEHRMYLPMFGCCLALVLFLAWLFSRKPPSVFMGVVTLVAAAYGVAALERNAVWGDQLRLTNDVINKSPRKPRAYEARALIYLHQKDYEKAIADLDRAIALDSTFVDAYLNRGTAHGLRGENERALHDFDAAVRFDSLDVRALIGRANVALQTGYLSNALTDLDRAAARAPNDPLIYANRGLVFFRLGNLARSIADYSRALSLDPGLVDAYFNRSMAYLRSGRADSAKQDVRRIQELGYRVSPDYLDVLTKADSGQ